MIMDEKYIPLGKTEIKSTPMGLGRMQFDDIRLSGHPDTQVDTEIHEVIQITLD